MVARGGDTVGAAVKGGEWRLARPAWWPPAELLIGPALVVLVIHAITTRQALFPNHVDLVLYFRDAEAFGAGGVPYRDFALEYPPLALVAMALPYVAWPFGAPDFDLYRWLFTAWQMCLLVGLVVVTGRLADLVAGERDHSGTASAVRIVGTRLLILVVAMAPSLTFRYDLLPALLAAAAVLAATRGRAGWAGVLLGLGGLAKVYPLVLVPILGLVWLTAGDRPRLVTFIASVGFTLAIVLLPFSLLTGDTVWSFMTYQAGRGLQLESVTAGLILLVSAIRGAQASLVNEFGAVHVGGPGADVFLTIQPLLLVLAPAVAAALGLIILRSDRSRLGMIRPQTIVALALATIALFIVTNRVISVQYVVWLLPLAAMLSRRKFWTTVAIAVLSMAVHPVFYDGLIDQELGVIVILCLRNALLLALPLWILADLLRAADGSTGARPGSALD